MTTTENITDYVNCSLRYLSNQTFLSPLSVFERYEECNILYTFIPEILMLVRLVIPVWLIVGIFGNSLSFVIWISKKQRKKNTSAIYLSALSLTDLIVIVIVASYHVDRYYCLPGFNAFPGVCHIYQGLSLLTQFYSATLVFGFTLERYIAVCYPFKRHKLCTHKRALVTVLILLAICSVPMIFQTTIWTFQAGQCVLKPEVHSTQWIKMVLIGQEVVFSLCVPLATLVLNILVLREMRHMMVRSRRGTSKLSAHSARENDGNKTRKTSSLSMKSTFSLTTPSSGMEEDKSRESSNFVSTTLMLVILSFYMIACSLGPGIVFLSQFTWSEPDECLTDEVIRRNPVWKKHFIEVQTKEIVDLLSASHFACNFVIYFLTYKKFRHHALEILSCKNTNKKADPSLDPYRRRSPRSMYVRNSATDDEKKQMLGTQESNGLS